MFKLLSFQLSFKKIIIIFLCTFVLTSCGGDDGVDGIDGANGTDGVDGNNGTSPPSPTPNQFSAIFTNVSVSADGILTIDFSLANEQGHSFIGLSNKNITFNVAKLFPENYLADGEPSNWQSYVNKMKSSVTDPDDSTLDKLQAMSESVSDDNFGQLTDHNDGTYTYIFNTNIGNVTTPAEVTYVAEHTHRVSIQISKVRGDDTDTTPTFNKTYTWQPSTGAIDNIHSRDIVDEATCNNCHGELAVHSGRRTNTKHCVTCHNPGSTDPTSGNTVDFKVMIHKIHRGTNLPSVIDGVPYVIWGGSPHDYSDVEFPQDIRNCSNCHDEENALPPVSLANGESVYTPDAANWFMNPSIEACTSCHDNLDFTVAGTEPNGHPGGPQEDSQLCSQCHGPNGGFPVKDMHEGIVANQQLAVDRLLFSIDSANVEVDKSLTVGITMMLDGLPVNYDDIKNYIAGGANKGALMINYDDGSGYQFSYSSPESAFGFKAETNLVKLKDCTPSGNNDGKHTCVRPDMAGASIGSEGALAITFVQMPLCVNEHASNGVLVDCASDDNTAEIAFNPPRKFFNLDGTEAGDYVEKVAADKASCESCHQSLDIHNVFQVDFDSHAATDFNQCTSCHNATKSAFYLGRPGDLKSHVHSFHAKADGVNVDKNLKANYPDDISNCNSCHSAGQFDIPLKVNTRASKAQIAATTVQSGAVIFTSATAVVCSSCHIKVPVGYIDPSAPGYVNTLSPSSVNLTAEEQSIVTHMVTNGAVFGSTNFDDANIVEACAVCHGPGKSVALEKVHNIR